MISLLPSSCYALVHVIGGGKRCIEKRRSQPYGNDERTEPGRIKSRAKHRNDSLVLISLRSSIRDTIDTIASNLFGFPLVHVLGGGKRLHPLIISSGGLVFSGMILHTKI